MQPQALKMAEPLAFGNGNELGDLNYLTSGDESEDENHRDDEVIKFDLEMQAPVLASFVYI